MNLREFARTLRLARKELSEILRDRRTIVTLIAMPLLLYPLLSVAFLQFVWLSKADTASGARYEIGFATEAEAHLFFARMEAGETALRRRSDKAAGANAAEFVPITATEEELRTGKLDLLVRIPNAEQVVASAQEIAQGKPPLRLMGRDWKFECEIYYVAGAPGGQGALALVERRLAAADAADLERRLDIEGVKSHTIMLRPTRVGIKVEEADKWASLASLVPLILILMTVTGAVYPAIDLTAGERERGTLEILIAAPVPRFSLLTAKYLAVVTVAVLTAVVNLVSMVITLKISGLSRQLLGDAGLTPLLIIELFGLLLLFAAFFSAVLLSLTSFARSFKEAQAYIIPLMLGSLGPGVLAMVPGVTLRAELAVLPLINIVLLARDLFNNVADPVLAALVVTTTLLYSVAALALAARVFGAESVLYSEQSGWTDMLRRPDEPCAYPSIASALWCLAVAIPLNFLAQSLLPREWLPAVAQVLFVAALSAVLFVGVPAVAAHLGRVQWRSGFGLSAPRPAALGAGVMLGLSLWPIVLRFLVHGTSLHGEHETIVEAMRRTRDAVGPLLLIVGIAAAVTEELFFRGYLFSALRSRTNAWTTIGVTAVLFGVTHVFLGVPLGLERLLPSTFLGVVLGAVCWVSGSIWPGMLLHVVHNTTLELLARSGWANRDDIPAAWVAAGAVGTTAGTVLLWFAWRRRPGNSPT